MADQNQGTTQPAGPTPSQGPGGQTAQKVSTPQTQSAAKAQEDQNKLLVEQHRAAVQGAEDTSSAVKRVADAAVDAVRSTSPRVTRDLIASGHPGGRLDVRAARVGVSFGASGSLLLNGKEVKTNGWSTQHIEAKLPSDAKSGELVVWIDESTQVRGYLEL